MLPFLILTLSITAGQLFRIPFGTSQGINLLDLSVIFLCFLGIYRLKFKLKKPPLHIKSALCFILVALVSLVLTPLKLKPQEYFISFSYTLRFSFYILLGWVVYSNAFDWRQKIKNVFIYSGIILAFLGLIQLIFIPDLSFLAKSGWDPHYLRAVSTFLDPNFLGAYLTLTMLLLLSENMRLTKIFFAITYIALLLTFSRGSYLAFLASFITLSFLRKSFKLGITSIVLFLGLLLGFYAYQIYVAAPRGIDRNKSAEFRLITWQQGWTIFSKHPVLGVGFNAYKYALKEYNIADGYFLQSRGSSTNDSSLLYIASTTGILGLIAYLFFLFSMIKKGNAILTAGIVGTITQSFFANTLFYPFILIWIILISSSYSDRLKRN